MTRRSKKVARNGDSRYTHVLKMKSRNAEVKGWTTVGVAWENADGHFTVRLNKGVVLEWRDFIAGSEFILCMFEADDA